MNPLSVVAIAVAAAGAAIAVLRGRNGRRRRTQSRPAPGCTPTNALFGRFEGLSLEQLDELWAGREDLELSNDEFQELRRLIREARGLDAIPAHKVEVCPQCGMVGGNCTCKRTWW